MSLLRAPQALRVCVSRLHPSHLVSFPRPRHMVNVHLHKTAGEGPQPEALFRPNTAELPEVDPTELPFPDLPRPEYDPEKEIPKPMSPPEPDNPMPDMPPNHPKEEPKGPEPEIPIPRRTSPASDPIRMPPEFSPPSVPEYPGPASEPSPEVSPGYQPVPEVSPQYPNRMGASSPDRERQEEATPKGPIA